ncbi:MAG: PD40 domain-containing protein [Saprospiraceae bacterium]|nr:PD40 domain-containing protein [Saprospiraceae bacterium]
MKQLTTLLLALIGLSAGVGAQSEARLFRMPDVSATHITFVYGDDVWIAPKAGGQAAKLSSPDGAEIFPRFSPDGKTVAFSGNYDGNLDIYTIPIAGGVPTRVTHHGMPDILQDWYPDGKNLLYTSSMHSGKQRFAQFYKVPATGGLPEKLPPAYGEFACFSPDGKQIAFVMKSQAFRTWKRYRGGTAADIFTFDLGSFASENITQNDANDEVPMWRGDLIYYLSDAGAEKRLNIWSYNLKTKQRRQITRFKDYDVAYPALGPDDIVFTCGGVMYLLNLASEKTAEVKIQVVTDYEQAKPRQINARPWAAWFTPSPDGNRLLVEARGEVFSVPAQKGYTVNLSQSSGSAERYPAWSPDGRYAAWWSDRGGEYQLVLHDFTRPDKDQTLTSFTTGFRYAIFWSPDSRKLAFVDQAMNIQVHDLDAKKTLKVDQAPDLFEGGLQNFKVSWSPDSRWMAYERGTDNNNPAIFIYDTQSQKTRQVSSGFYADYNPVFDREGKYLFFITNRSFSPTYSEFEGAFIYNKSNLIAVATLRADLPGLLAPQNDTVAVKLDTGDKKAGKDKDEEAKKDSSDVKAVGIDFEGLENRVVVLPMPAGNYGNLAAAEDKLLYLTVVPQAPPGEPNLALKYFHLKDREDKTVMEGINGYELSADGKKIMIIQKESVGMVSPEPDQKLEKPAPLDRLDMTLDPRAEWAQIFNEVWRLERDYFYEKEMHGVDWPAMRKRYGDLLPYAASRSDLNYLIGELIGELNASHTYRGGGDAPAAKQQNTGYLGVDWALENGYFRIKKIIHAAPWDTEQRSPLDAPGLGIREGDYVLAVNGRPLDTQNDPWTAFQGLGGATVALTVNNKPGWDGARTLSVGTLDSETRLRNLAWIESNRKRVEEASGGRIGYVYVPSTGIDGQNELVRMFYAQWNKPGLIIDERFNNGGQIPDRFIELLNRKPLAFWAVRDGRTWQWPSVAHFGPKAMLINGWSGSGGDAFPDYFRKAGLGPLIGTRTWGGLIGISGNPGLIDGGSVTVPTFRMYNPDGKWFPEGYGVAPDIEVPEDPTALAKGNDPQLERAIQEVLKQLEKTPKPVPARPAREDRSN